MGDASGEREQLEEALKAAAEAVEHHRALAQGNPDALPDLAMSLETLGICLAASWRNEEAVEALSEAVELRRGQAQRNPDAFQPSLATSLYLLGHSYRGMQDGLPAMREAVDLYRTVAQRNPDAFQPDPAMRLSVFDIRLDRMRRGEKVVKAAVEAVEFHRVRVQRDPDAFQPDLARSLHSLVRRLDSANDLEPSEEALTATQEMVSLYRVLAQRDPEAFRRDLLTSLDTLNHRLSRLGRHEEALTAREEALTATVGLVEWSRILAQRNPEALSELASHLGRLGYRLSELGRHEEALTATQEAVNLYRTRVQLHPEELQSSLGDLCARLSRLGRREEALKAAAEAVELLWAQAQPFTFPDSPLFMVHADKGMHLLLSRLHTLGTLLTELGELEVALTAAPEWVELPRALAQRDPDAFLLDVAGNLQHLADWMDTAQIPDVAASAAWMAVTFFLAAFQPGSGRRLGHLGSIWKKLGRDEGSRIAVPEALELGRALARRDPEAFQARLASILDALGHWLHESGQHEEELTAVVGLVELRRALARPYPDNTQFDLISSLVKLGMVLGELERDEEALAPFQEALDTLWPFSNHFHESWELAEELLSHLRFVYSVLERPLSVALQERVAAFERLKKSGRVLLS